MQRFLLLLATLPLVPSLARAQTLGCLEKIRNQAGTPPCLEASSTPTLGKLYPLSVDFNVDAYGNIASGHIGPYNLSGNPLSRFLTLDVGTSFADVTLELVRNTDVDGYGNGDIQFINSHNIGQQQIAVIQAGTVGSSTNKGGALQFFTKPNLGPGIVSRMIILDDGKTGIGTQNPTERLEVNGTIKGAVKMFRIDHPLDPENKTLEHACIESSEMLNLYRGNVVLDGFGAATVEMPAWFEALNEDIGYLLTPVGAPAPSLYVAAELQEGSFRIAGGSPGMKVSWQVTGERKDDYARAHPLVVERDKGRQRGQLLYPEERLAAACAEEAKRER